MVMKEIVCTLRIPATGELTESSARYPQNSSETDLHYWSTLYLFIKSPALHADLLISQKTTMRMNRPASTLKPAYQKTSSYLSRYSKKLIFMAKLLSDSPRENGNSSPAFVLFFVSLAPQYKQIVRKRKKACLHLRAGTRFPSGLLRLSGSLP